MDETLKRLVLKSLKDDEVLQELESTLESIPMYAAQLGTTQAADIVGGGIKSNALPEKAWAIVNHRIFELRYVSSKELEFSALYAMLKLCQRTERTMEQSLNSHS